MRHNNLKAAAICREAADIIRRLGLAKGWFFDAAGGVCVLGALNSAAGLSHTDTEHDDEECEKAYGATLTAAGLSVPERLCDWNDKEDTTAEKVASTLDRAALALASGSRKR